MEYVEAATSDDETPELADQQLQPLLRGGRVEAARASIVNVAEEETDIENNVTRSNP